MKYADPYRWAEENNYGMDMFQFMDMIIDYEAAIKSGDTKTVRNIEDILTEINYHTERRFLQAGKYKQALEAYLR